MQRTKEHLVGIAILAIAAMAIDAATLSTLRGGGLPVAVEKFYEALRPEIQEHFNATGPAAEAERLRKAKAGERPLNEAEQKLGAEGIKFFLYNVAVIKALCYEHTASSQTPKEWEGRYKECLKVKLGQLDKYTKLGEYGSSLDSRKVIRCEIKTRDYDNELRFQPYDFLMGSSSRLKLFRYGELNDCILSGL